MAGLMQLKSKIKRLTKASKVALEGRVVSVVHMDPEGNVQYEDGVNYNDGLLVVPIPSSSIQEWEARYSSKP